MGYLPDTLILNIPLGYSINYIPGYIAFFTPSITSLFFLIPYLISIILSTNKKTKKSYIILLCLGVIISLIIGRRALIVIILISPIILIILNSLVNLNYRLIIKFVALLVLLVFVFSVIIFIILSIDEVNLRIEAFGLAGGNSARYKQFFALLNGWSENPILGSGFGVNADIIRSKSVPGAYELTYVARLFQTGIVGSTIYILLISFIYYSFIKIMKVNKKYINYFLPVLTGTTAFLIATFTNPYIGSFDGLWILFYPLALINNALLKNN